MSTDSEFSAREESHTLIRLLLCTCACEYIYIYTCMVAQMVKNLPAMWETQVLYLSQEEPLEKEMAAHSSILAWEMPWTWDYKRVRYNLASKQ